MRIKDPPPSSGRSDATLATPGGIDRASAGLDAIRERVAWWEAGARPAQLLADGEVAMTVAWNGRIFDAAVGEGQPFGIARDGQAPYSDAPVIPKGAPNREAAPGLIRSATATDQLARQSGHHRPRASAPPGLRARRHPQGQRTPMAPDLPAAPERMANALTAHVGCPVDNGAELEERFRRRLLAGDRLSEVRAREGRAHAATVSELPASAWTKRAPMEGDAGGTAAR